MTEMPTVIVVDDDPLIRGALGSLIRSVGVHVKTLASVSEFLDDGRRTDPLVSCSMSHCLAAAVSTFSASSRRQTFRYRSSSSRHTATSRCPSRR